MKKLLQAPADPAAERVLFALVANRALAPSSKLAATRWIEHDSHIPGLPATGDDACYRAMDWLLDVERHLAREASTQVADLLNLEVDLLFFDTTSTYFETGANPTTPTARDEHGRRLDAPTDTTDMGEAATATSTGERRRRRATATRRDGDRATAGRGWRRSVRTARGRTTARTCRRSSSAWPVTRDGIPIRVWSWPGQYSGPGVDPPGPRATCAHGS